jgi:hypothetical protein
VRRHAGWTDAIERNKLGDDEIVVATAARDLTGIAVGLDDDARTRFEHVVRRRWRTRFVQCRGSDHHGCPDDGATDDELPRVTRRARVRDADVWRWRPLWLGLRRRDALAAAGELGVIEGTATRIAQHPVRLIDGGHRADVRDAAVRVVHAGQPAVRAADLLRRSRRRDPEDLIVGDDPDAMG